ncbi:MAG TPA: Ger(x)C family spore germination protein [Limnochordia bacterium]|nr:Ger(x)C family spore germination protein [Limnochordia bacterium]
MKTLTPKLKLMLVMTLALSLAGCWDYTEIELLDFVLGGGVDATRPDVIVVTEMARSTGTGQEAAFEPVVLTTQAANLSGAIRAMLSPSGMEVFWPHAQVFLVSEEVARQGMLAVLGYIVRTPEMRSTMYMFVTQDCTVEEVLKSKPPLLDAVSQHLISLVRLSNMISTYIPTQIWQFTGDLATQGMAATLPTVRLVNEAGDLVPVVEGTAVFKRDEMIGWLDGEETQILSLLRGLKQQGYFVMDTRVEEMIHPVTYQFRGNQVEMKPVVDGERVSMKIRLTLQLGLVELGDTTITLEDSLIRSMEEQLSHTFARRIQDFFSEVQKEHNADVLGFGRMLMQKHPDMWRSRSENWDAVFPNLPIETEVKCRITFTGLRRDSLIVRP